MIFLVVILVLLALGVTLVVGELRRAPRRATTWSRGKRVVVMGALGGLMMVALSPSLMLTEERDLPTERPPEPWRNPGEGCGDSDSGAWLLVVAVGIYIALRGGPGLAGVIGGAIRRPGAPRREPDGRFALRVTTIGFAVVGGLVTLRVAACGATADQFTTYGALTPVNGGGWRVDLAIALAAGDRAPIPRGEPIAAELEYHGGSDMGIAHGPFTSALPGLQAWVGDQPVLFHVEAETHRLVGSAVAIRDPDQIPHARRPHYAAWPEVARLDDEHLLIVGPTSGGGTLAVKVTTYDADAVAATYADAGLLIRPPLLPWFLALALGALALALTRRARRLDDPAIRMLASWLLLEAIGILLYGELAAFGVAYV